MHLDNAEMVSCDKVSDPCDVFVGCTIQGRKFGFWHALAVMRRRVQKEVVVGDRRSIWAAPKDNRDSKRLPGISYTEEFYRWRATSRATFEALISVGCARHDMEMDVEDRAPHLTLADSEDLILGVALSTS